MAVAGKTAPMRRRTPPRIRSASKFWEPVPWLLETIAKPEQE